MSEWYIRTIKERVRSTSKTLPFNMMGDMGKNWMVLPETLQTKKLFPLHTMIEALVLTQLPMHKGLNVFGEAGTKAVMEELDSYISTMLFNLRRPTN